MQLLPTPSIRIYILQTNVKSPYFHRSLTLSPCPSLRHIQQSLHPIQYSSIADVARCKASMDRPSRIKKGTHWRAAAAAAAASSYKMRIKIWSACFAANAILVQFIPYTRCRVPLALSHTLAPGTICATILFLPHSFSFSLCIDSY